MSLSVKWPFPNKYKISKLRALQSKVTIAIIGTCSKIWADWANKMTVHNKDTLMEAIENRPPDVPLVTLCNHHSCLDEPVLWGMLKWKHLVTNNKVMRWTLAAADVCFTKERYSKFFALGQCVPVVRGGGVYQQSMDFVVDRLNHGKWVHIYPEGKINADNEYLRLKWGVGRLIADCRVSPIVLPFWHIGMDDILPNKTPYIPQTGKEVTVLIGNPMDFTDMLRELRKSGATARTIRKKVTDVLQAEFRTLQEQAEAKHFSKSLTKS